MSLNARIFPPGPPHDGLIARTEFVGSWESQFRGLGRLTAFLTEYLFRFSAAVDDIALNVVFLQRHRVEVGLKLVLERSYAEVPITHDISALALRALDAVGATTHSQLVAKLSEANELIKLMDNADPKSMAYRYPVDTENQPATRAPYVDLRELETAGARFEVLVLEIVDALAIAEPVPVEDNDVMPTIEDAAAAIRAVRTVVALTEKFYTVMENDRDEMARVTGRASLREPTAKTAEARAAADEQFELLATLEKPLLGVVQRLMPRLATAEAVLPSLDPAELADPPRFQIASLPAIAQHLHQRMEWVAQETATHLVELKRALAVMEKRTATWPSPADRQLNADLGRFLSRLMSSIDPLNLADEDSDG